MNKQEQKNYLRECIRTFVRAKRRANYIRNLDDAPKSVRDARERIEKDEKIIRRWEVKQRKKGEALCQRMGTDLARLRRSFAFNDAEETLKLWDSLVKKYPVLKTDEAIIP